MRLFVALEIPLAIRSKIASLVDDLRDMCTGAPPKQFRWVPAENLHITLKFIGSVPSEHLDAICASLGRIHLELPVHIQFSGVQFFMKKNHPRVLSIPVAAPTNLSLLVSEIDRRLAAHGIPTETRPFLPHLTLARIPIPHIPDKIRAAIQSVATRDFGALSANTFHLFQSHLKSSGAEYTILQLFPFTAELPKRV